MGVLLLLLIGFALSTGVWLDLYWLIVPRPPVLSSRELQGSTMASLYERSIEGGYEYETELYRVYRSGNERNLVSIKQITTWYMSSDDSINAWQNPINKVDDHTYYSYTFRLFDVGDKSSFDKFQKITLPNNMTIPSILYCQDWNERRRTCVYFGYYQNWFTQIWFRSEDKSILSQELMNDLIKKAVRILLEAPPPTP